MEIFPRSKKYWHVVESEVAELEEGAALLATHKTDLEAMKLKDLKVKNDLLQAIDRSLSPFEHPICLI